MMVLLFLRLVGRAAFTGNHEWILASNYIGDAHPPEVYSYSSSAYSREFYISKGGIISVINCKQCTSPICFVSVDKFSICCFPNSPSFDLKFGDIKFATHLCFLVFII